MVKEDAESVLMLMMILAFKLRTREIYVSTSTGKQVAIEKLRM